ncbi:MAG: tRNA pseudouridine(38-40) synthase TruA [Planctomycetes bacterium]|nr:tRNA pseudouridine(38-40) synthase TruA [Planctomycetota bacterium]
MLRNIRILIEYDGTAYSGWQVQPGCRTIQGLLAQALHAVTGENVTLVGSGRTDAGVHAEGQVAHFHTRTRIPAWQLVFALNSRLPPDIAVLQAEDVPLEFHAQFHVRSKSYRYLIWNSKVRPALHQHRWAWVRYPLDLGKMRDAASFFVGTHDFKSFASASAEKDTIRTVKRLDLDREGHLIRLEIEANGFLYNMVRAIAGTLIEVGRGHRSVEEVPDTLQARDRRRGGPTAPACGLYLVRVDYG